MKISGCIKSIKLRKNGAAHFLEVLHRHFDFLEGMNWKMLTTTKNQSINLVDALIPTGYDDWDLAALLRSVFCLVVFNKCY
jgi:hypothetical protein